MWGVIMGKITKIILDKDFIKMEFDDNELSIPRNQDYVEKNMNDALLESYNDLRDSRFYRKGAKICSYAMIYAAGLFFGCYLADIVLLKLMAVLCSGLGGLSLVSYSFFKLSEIKSLEKAYNNEYWLKIRDLAVNNINKTKESKKQKVITKNINSNKKVKTNTFYNNLNEVEEITKSSRKL